MPAQPASALFAAPPPAVRREETRASPELAAARALTADLESRVSRAAAFRQLPEPDQRALLRDLRSIQQALSGQREPARALETPQDLRRRLFAQNGSSAAPPQVDSPPEQPGAGVRKAATETLAQRAGALIDEIDFPTFVAGLVHGTFDAIVDAAIRQMESFADLVSAVAKDVDTFTAENVSLNQARDWLVEKHPRDVEFVPGAVEPRLRPRADAEGEPPAPHWLAEYGLEPEPLSEELLEDQVIPLARRKLGESRMQLLATMVLLGMNRVVVRDGSIRARVRFRAAAQDKAQVEYAVSQDPGGGSSGWGSRGSSVYASHSTMISTVGVNAQTESSLQAELFGEVHINFASETVPLDRFIDQARMTLLQRNARASSWRGPEAGTPLPSAAPAPAAPPAAPPQAPAVAAAPPAPAASTPAA